MAEVLTEELSFGRYKYGYGTDGAQVRKLIWIDDTPFTPADLFLGGVAGSWYDPSDLSSMFQDTAGTVPVAADNDPVGRINDKSGNANHLLQATAGFRPLYKTAGGLHWLQFDGVDDYLAGTIPVVGLGGNLSKTLMIANRLGNIALQEVVGYGASGSGTKFGFYVNGGANLLDQGTAEVTGNASQAVTSEVWTGLKNEDSHTFRSNAVVVGGPANLPTANIVADPFVLGCGLTIANFSSARVYGIIFPAGVLSGLNLAYAETWLGAKAGLVI